MKMTRIIGCLKNKDGENNLHILANYIRLFQNELKSHFSRLTRFCKTFASKSSFACYTNYGMTSIVVTAVFIDHFLVNRITLSDKWTCINEEIRCLGISLDLFPTDLLCNY